MMRTRWRGSANGATSDHFPTELNPDGLTSFNLASTRTRRVQPTASARQGCEVSNSQGADITSRRLAVVACVPRETLE